VTAKRKTIYNKAARRRQHNLKTYWTIQCSRMLKYNIVCRSWAFPRSDEAGWWSWEEGSPVDGSLVPPAVGNPRRRLCNRGRWPRMLWIRSSLGWLGFHVSGAGRREFVDVARALHRFPWEVPTLLYCYMFRSYDHLQAENILASITVFISTNASGIKRRSL
jgi:hypothetical protein